MYPRGMAQCPSCEADGYRADARCGECGYAAPGVKVTMPDLVLDVPQPPPKPVGPPKKKVEDAKLELAVDLATVQSTPPPGPRMPSTAPSPGIGSVAPFVAVRAHMRPRRAPPAGGGPGTRRRGA